MDRINKVRLLIGLALIAALVWIFAGMQGDNSIPYTEFRQAVEQGRVEQVTFTGEAIKGEFADGETFTSQLPPQTVIGEDGVEQFLTEHGVTIAANPQTDSPWFLLIWILPALLLIGFFVWMNRQARGQMGGLTQIGKSQAKVHKPHEPTTRFTDVAGYGEVKEEVEEVVSFLKDPDRFRKAGAKVPKGMMMVGPPGTGKTLLARAVAGEAGVPFISVAGSDFMEMFVGVGASRVRDLFKTARANAPCIIFIDELDSIGRKRGAGLGGGHDEREQTLNQLLGEIDGFEGSEGVVIMAATNRPDVLDEALQRPGRFDRQIIVPLPTLEERIEILEVHTKGKPLADDADLRTLARGTPGMSGADLNNLVNEAALIAVRDGSEEIHMRDLEAARERQTIGRERTSLRLDEDEKRSVAFHEGGHALAAFLEPEADPVYKITVLPVGMALGVTTQLPIDDRHIYLRSYLDAKIRVMLGGRAAEMVVLGQPTTGGQHDLVQATKLCRAIVKEYGMSDALGPVGYGDEQQVFLGEELSKGHEYSERTAETVDAEVQRLLTEALDHVCQRFDELRPGLEAMAEALVEKESLSGEAALQIIRDALPPDKQELLRGRATMVEAADTAQGDVEAERDSEQAGVA